MNENKEEPVIESEEEELTALSHGEENESINIENNEESEDFLKIDEFEEDEEETEGDLPEEEEQKSKKTIPEWAKKNPVGWATKVARGVKKELVKKHAEEMAVIQARQRELEEKLNQLSPKQEVAQEEHLQEYPEGIDEYSFVHPETGMILNGKTLAGQFALGQHELELEKKKQDEIKRTEELKKSVVEASDSRAKRWAALENDIIEASKKNKEIGKVIVETVAQSINSSDPIVDFISYMKGNTVDFFYYLAGNRNEWNRLTALHPESRSIELLRHHAEYHSRKNIQNKASVVTSEGNSISKPNHSKDDLAEEMRKMYNRVL